MSATPSRALLLLTGAGFLGLFVARVAGPYAFGMKVGGGMMFWHFAVGMVCLLAGGLSRHDYSARRAAYTLGLVTLLVGIVIAGTRDSAGYTMTDAFAWVGASGGLLIGAMVSDPKEETFVRRLSS
jgi:peptidoglycan/LPS O-acetylase OafA/YrhL